MTRRPAAAWDTVPGVAPARLLAGDDLSLQAVDAEGLVSAVRLEAHLSVV